ncbi:MAG: tetratricopeptide repeat protein, partial [bacterium]
RAVQMSQNYLEAFPESPNAYMVNYNLAVILDQNLNKPALAFAEYIKVSSVYSDVKFREVAARSAVFIAQKMMASQDQKPSGSPLPSELNDAEQKYLLAVENYLSLYPDTPEAEVFFLNAGSIYYNHGLYDQSKKYYEKLLADFPTGSKRSEAYLYLMNGYFASGDYAEAEKIAKEIQTAGLDSTSVAQAKTRQAESIFLGAQNLRERDELLASAQEFKRIALETPDYQYADKALFESGLTFQRTQAWQDANSVYLLLTDRYPISEFAPKAIYNAAFNSQGELNDPKTAAQLFERVTAQYPESPLVKDALRNASINYTEVADWAGAIRVNSRYVQLFPTAADVNVFLFENAGLHLKLGDEATANQIYADFVSRFPDDPRAVSVHWERGSYLKERGLLTEALAEFSAGLETHRRFIHSGKPGDEAAASSCLLELFRDNFAKFEAVQFAPSATAESHKKEKLARRDQLLSMLSELNRMAKLEMFEGLFSVGKLEEELSRAFQLQELPENKDAAERILLREIAYQDAIEVAKRAMEAYRKAAEEMAEARRVLKTEEETLLNRKAQLAAFIESEQNRSPETAGLADSSNALTACQRGLQEIQDAAQNAETWRQRALDRIPELALRNAELEHSISNDLVSLPDAGKTEALRMQYRADLLAEFILPRAEETARLYALAMQEAALSSDANRWQDKCLRGVQDLFTAIQGDYRRVNQRVLEAYSMDFTAYQSLLEKGEGARSPNGLQAADLAGRMVLLTDQSFDFAVRSLQGQAALLSAIEENHTYYDELASRYAATITEEMLGYSEEYSGLKETARTSKANAEARAQESVIWEDAVMSFEDCAYNFAEHQESLLESTYTFNQEHGADPIQTQRIAWALVELDRAKHLPLLAQYGTESWLRSDESFRANLSFHSNWEVAEFSDENWFPPQVTATSPQNVELSGCKSLWLPVNSEGIQTTDSLYLRKTFEIPEVPVAGDLWINVDGGFALQVNGELLDAREPAEGWSETVHYDVATVLQSGSNVIAIFATDPDGSNGGVVLALRYKSLPSPQPGGP